jgi:hypothetical protein
MFLNSGYYTSKANSQVAASIPVDISNNIYPFLWVSAEPVGRLGNQMFVSASSYGIAQSRGARWCLRNTRFIDDVVEWINKPETCPENIGQFTSLDESSKYGAYVSSLVEDQHEKNVSVGTYLQSFKYFSNYGIPFKLRAKQWGEQWVLQHNIDIGIHVRRGDYLTLEYYEGITPPVDYYTAAIQYIRDKIGKTVNPSSIFVCSDDLPWIRSQPIFEGMVFSQGEFGPGEDMAILSACSHLILSAGTFSLWSAYLSTSNNSIKIYYSEPNKEWTNSVIVPGDYFMPEWVGLNQSNIQEIILSSQIEPPKQCYAWVSFADSKYAKTLARISEEAKAFGIFHYMFAFNESDLDPEFWARHGDFITGNKRGFGYWIWKPYVIDLALSKIPSGCFLFYTDAGCLISAPGVPRALEYVKTLETNNKDVLGFEMGHQESTWSKGDVYAYFNVSPESLEHKGQIMATSAVFRQSPRAVSLVKKWRDIMENNYNLIDDSPSVTPNNPGFVENRHDQSIFSMLVKNNRDTAFIIPDDSWPAHAEIPFQGMRIKF